MGMMQKQMPNGDTAFMTMLVDETGNPYKAGAAQLATTGGLTTRMVESTADTNLVSVKASPGLVYGYDFQNKSANLVRVTLYDKASAPVVAADAALRKRIVRIPAGGLCQITRGQGLGFTSGIAYTITTDAGAAVAAGDVTGSIDYN